jgi:uncharacterized protein (DUF2147 family)
MSKHFKQISKLVILLFLIFGFSNSSKAQTDPIEGVWLNEEKDARIQIYKAQDNKFYGKIIWLKEPNENGAPKLDKKNPNKGERNKNIVGKIILKEFEREDKKYDDGTIYDPQNGKTYDATITYKGNTLALRGYVGISLFGRTTVWERVSTP